MKKLLAYAALSALVSGCSKVSTTAGGGEHSWTKPGILRVAIQSEPKNLNTLLSSAVAELTVEATFHLTKDESGKWRVADVSIGDASVGDLAALWRSADEQKAARARQDLEALSAALEAFRRERGFYVVATDSAALMDHLSPRYIKQIIRLDPWHNPYRYTGTTAAFTLASDGPDGKPGTADDVTISH